MEPDKQAVNLQSQYLGTILPEQLDSELMRRLPLEFLKKQRAIPLLLEKGQVAIALAEAHNVEAFDAISTVLGLSCVRVVCPAGEIEQAIGCCYYDAGAVANPDEDRSRQEPSGQVEAVSATGARTQAEDLLNIANKAPVVKLVNKIFFQAVNSRASDIHTAISTSSRTRMKHGCVFASTGCCTMCSHWPNRKSPGSCHG
jgi:type II secretory ATPase GspE/PulE/Tfp pilus assembly ATPase PilB-like protein